MAKSEYPFSLEEFHAIYSKVPRLTIEIIIHNKNAIYLTKRAVEPFKGQWHIPGGTVFFGEPLLESVKRIGKRELGININDAVPKGHIEYPSHYKNGLDSPVGIVFEVNSYEGSLQPNAEASDGDWFTTLPANTHADQDMFLVREGYLKAA